MKTICETIGVARSNVAARAAGRTPRRRGRPPLPEDALLAEIRTVIADLPSYGYARVWAVLRRRAVVEGRQPANRKRVYRVMRVYGLLLHRHAGRGERRHDGTVAVPVSNLRWCSDGFEIACDNAEKVRVASIAATARPWAMSPPPRASREMTCAISWSSPSNSASARSTACR